MALEEMIICWTRTTPEALSMMTRADKIVRTNDMRLSFYIIPTIVGILLFGALAFMGNPASIGEIPSEVLRSMTEGDVLGSWVTLIVFTSLFSFIAVLGNYFLSRNYIAYALLDWDGHMKSWESLLADVRSAVKSNKSNDAAG